MTAALRIPRREPQHGQLRRQRGAASVEFYIVALLVLLPLVMAILQLGMLYVAKNTLNHATFMAARAGSMANGSRSVMLQHLAKGLVPLYARTSEPVDSSNAVRIILPAFAQARLDVSLPTRTRLEILNPTRASFRDFEVRQNGVLQIPNDSLQFRRANGASSRQTIQEANLLKIRVDYCYPLIFPVIDAALISLLRLGDTSLFHQVCYADNRVPISAWALVHMQSPARRSQMGALR
jgi:TadE-like protein